MTSQGLLSLYPQCFRQLGSLTDMLQCQRFSLGVKKVIIWMELISSFTQVDLHHCRLSSDNLHALSSKGLKALTLGRSDSS